MGVDGNYHIVTFRGMLDDKGCWLHGRVLKRPVIWGPKAADNWWDNLLNTYRRFDSERMPGVSIDASFRGRVATAITDVEGYYELHIPLPAEPASGLWETAEITRSEGGPVFLQPVLCVPRNAAFGVISDIDDTVLESGLTHWRTAAQLTFLHNAQTRKPLEGVAKLYQAFQRGRAANGPNPIFYVSASPWNLYDLLEDFFDLNDIPQGPILLRDLDLDRKSLRSDLGARSKLAQVRKLLDRYPSLRWILIGDSGQLDAQTYAAIVRKYPGRILAVYIRDVDPMLESRYDTFVDRHINRIAASGVPMLRVTDSNAIAAHARSLGLIDAEEIAEVSKEVQRDQNRPDVKEVLQANVKEALQQNVNANGSDPAQPAGR